MPVGLVDIDRIGRTSTALADSIRLKGSMLHAHISQHAVNTAFIAKCLRRYTCAYNWDSGRSTLHVLTKC